MPLQFTAKCWMRNKGPFIESRPATAGSRDFRGLKKEERGTPSSSSDGRAAGGWVGGRGQAHRHDHNSLRLEGRPFASAKECARPAPREFGAASRAREKRGGRERERRGERGGGERKKERGWTEERGRDAATRDARSILANFISPRRVYKPARRGSAAVTCVQRVRRNSASIRALATRDGNLCVSNPIDPASTRSASIFFQYSFFL